MPKRSVAKVGRSLRERRGAIGLPGSGGSKTKKAAGGLKPPAAFRSKRQGGVSLRGLKLGLTASGLGDSARLSAAIGDESKETERADHAVGGWLGNRGEGSVDVRGEVDVPIHNRVGDLCGDVE